MLKVSTHYQDQVNQIILNEAAETSFVNKANQKLAHLNQALEKLNLELVRISHHKTGMSPNWADEDYLKLTIVVAPLNTKFKFIKDQGYTASGSGRNQGVLNRKAIKIADALKSSCPISFQVNPFSLEYKGGEDTTGKTILIDAWVK